MTSGPAENGSYGYGNYNGGFVSLKMADWRGLTMQSNFTYSEALGTGAVTQSSSSITPDDAFNLQTTYGYQNFNRKFVCNFFFVYQPPFFNGQSGLLGRALGGWTFSSVFAAGSGTPVELFTSTGDGQEYGSGDNSSYFSNANAIQIAPIKSGHAYSQPGNFPNIFAAGPSAINDFRNPILGLDYRDGGNGNLIGLPYWNMDFSVRKNIKVAESVSLEFQGVFANVFNHNQWLDPVGIFGSGLFSGSGPGGFATLSGGSAQEGTGRQPADRAGYSRSLLASFLFLTLAFGAPCRSLPQKPGCGCWLHFADEHTCFAFRIPCLLSLHCGFLSPSQAILSGAGEPAFWCVGAWLLSRRSQSHAPKASPI